MEKEKIAIIAQKVKAFAMTLVGVIFFGLGTSYFQEQYLYRVPRILIPVFELLGNVGLAVGMLILGGGLIYYSFTKWKAVSQNNVLFWVVAAIGLAVSCVCANVEFKSQRSTDIMTESENRRQAQIEEARNVEKPDFKNEKITNFFDDFDILAERFRENLQNKDEAAIRDCETKFVEWAGQLSGLMENLSNKEKEKVTAYYAKLCIEWNDLRQLK